MDGVQCRVPITHTNEDDVKPPAVMSDGERTLDAPRSWSYMDAQLGAAPYGAFNPVESITQDLRTKVADGDGVTYDGVTVAVIVGVSLMVGDSVGDSDTDTVGAMPGVSLIVGVVEAEGVYVRVAVFVDESERLPVVDCVGVNVPDRVVVGVREGDSVIVGVASADPVDDTDGVQVDVTERVRVTDVDPVRVGDPDAVNVSDTLDVRVMVTVADTDDGGELEGVGRVTPIRLPPNASWYFTMLHGSCDTHRDAGIWFVMKYGPLSSDAR